MTVNPLGGHPQDPLCPPMAEFMKAAGGVTSEVNDAEGETEEAPVIFWGQFGWYCKSM